MRFFIPLLLLLTYSLSHAQTSALEGYWQVETVTVGTDNMTPVAKWFHLGPTGVLQGGNGGNINLFGSWKINDNTQLLFSDENGNSDPAGPFSILQKGDQMNWTRTEEGQDVLVSLKRFDAANWPRAPWDQIIGNWNCRLEESTATTIPVKSVFFRWDHLAIFNRRTDQLVWRALWRINAHRPELELAPYQEDQPNSNWQISFSEDQMIWTRIVDGSEERLVWSRE